MPKLLEMVDFGRSARVAGVVRWLAPILRAQGVVEIDDGSRERKGGRGGAREEVLDGVGGGDRG